MRPNRVDACISNHKFKQVLTLEMSCPWIDNRTRKDEEKTLKSRSNKEIELLVNTVRIFSDDIHLQFGLDKCAKVIEEN